MSMSDAPLAALPAVPDRRHAALRGARWCSLFWLPRVPRYRMAARWCRDQRHGRARDLRDPLAGRGPRERSADTRAAPAHRDVQAQLDVGDAGAQPVLPAACLRGQEGAPVDPVLRLGRSRSPRRSRSTATPAPTRWSRSSTQGRERFAQGFWIVIYPEGTRIRAGTRAKYKTGGARLAIAHERAGHAGRAQRGLPLAQGRVGQAAGTHHHDHRRADLADGQGPVELTAEVEHWIEAEVARLGVPRCNDRGRSLKLDASAARERSATARAQITLAGEPSTTA